MANSPQQTAVGMANQAIALGQQLAALDDAVGVFMNSYNQIVPDTQWSAMATAATATDGSISGTPDGSPNNAHPITVSALNKSRNQLISLITAFIQFRNLTGNAAVTTGAYGTNIRLAVL